MIFFLQNEYISLCSYFWLKTIAIKEMSVKSHKMIHPNIEVVTHSLLLTTFNTLFGFALANFDANSGRFYF